MDIINLDEMLCDTLSSGVLPEPYMYQYYRCLNENIVIINGVIDDNFLENAIIPLMQMDKNPDITQIDVILNTDGGDVYNGFAIIPVLESIKTPTTIHIIGRALSMGSLIAMAKGKNLKVVCNKYTVALIHAGSYYIEGNMYNVKDTFQFAQRYEEKIKQYILSHTKISEDMYAQIERQEFWMDADEMLEYGIVDEIV